MRRGLMVGLAVIGAVLATTGSVSHASIRAWSLAEARTHLAAAGEFSIVDVTQSDQPRFWITVGLLGALSPFHGRLVFGPPGPAD